MMTQSLRLDSAGTIQGDHQRLHAQLVWLHEQLAAARLPEAEADRELIRTEAELEEHFTHEESGGFFAEIRDLSPELEDRVRNLLREHQEMRAMFRSLRMTCRWACSESGGRTGWLGAFADFHRRFDAHEHAENDVLYEALQHDVGVGD
jgi:hypothetical protein